MSEVNEPETMQHLAPRNLGEIVIKITPYGYETMEFLFAKQLAREQRKNRQEWLQMTEAEEAENKHSVAVKTLANLLREEPLNVPLWDKIKEDNPNASLAERFALCFLNEENEVFIDQLETLYLGKLLPAEFYENLSK